MSGFTLGCSVRVIDENAMGMVTQITNKTIRVLLSETGFEEDFNEDELVLNETFEVGDLPKMQAKINQTIQKRVIEDEVVFDLHFGQIVDFPKRYPANERLSIQLKAAANKIAECRKKKVKCLILVHGHGTGILRNSLHDYLRKQPKIEFFDANWQRYKGGATEVRFK